MATIYNFLKKERLVVAAIVIMAALALIWAAGNTGERKIFKGKRNVGAAPPAAMNYPDYDDADYDTDVVVNRSFFDQFRPADAPPKPQGKLPPMKKVTPEEQAAMDQILSAVGNLLKAQKDLLGDANPKDDGSSNASNPRDDYGS